MIIVPIRIKLAIAACAISTALLLTGMTVVLRWDIDTMREQQIDHARNIARVLSRDFIEVVLQSLFVVGHRALPG